MATLWESAAHSVGHMFFFVLSICNFSFLPLSRFRGRDVGSDCISSWSLLTFHFLYIQDTKREEEAPLNKLIRYKGFIY